MLAAFITSAVGLFRDEKKLPAIIGLAISALAGLGLFLGWFKLCF